MKNLAIAYLSLFVVPPMVAGNANAICHWTCFRTALSHTLSLLPSLAYAVDTGLIRCCSFVCHRMMLKYKTGFNGIIGQVFGLVQ